MGRRGRKWRRRRRGKRRREKDSEGMDGRGKTNRNGRVRSETRGIPQSPWNAELSIHPRQLLFYSPCSRYLLAIILYFFIIIIIIFFFFFY
jgi:hypothetical protein